MTFTFYTFLFTTFLVLHICFETVIDTLQIRHLKKNRARIPKHLKGKTDIETVTRAANYNIEKLWFGMVTRFLGLLPLWLMIVRGFTFCDNLLRSLDYGPVVTGLLYLGFLSVAAGILALPEELYYHFSIEKRWGFNKQTISSFFLDKIKELLVGMVLIGILLSLVLYTMEHTQYWWLVAYVIVAVFQVAMMWIYPKVIMPMFNKFLPVSNELSSAIGVMARKVDFPLHAVYQMDGSKRSAHSNAFIIGLKGARRIVLYDTLIEKLSTSELVAVLAHELGHHKLGHVTRRLVMMAIIGGGGFGLLGWMASQPDLYSGLGFSQSSSYAALIVFSLFVANVTFPFAFVFNHLSRRDEYAADAFATSATGETSMLKNALIGLTKQNLSGPGSHKWYRMYHNSHPSLRERLRALDRLSSNNHAP